MMPGNMSHETVYLFSWETLLAGIAIFCAIVLWSRFIMSHYSVLKDLNIPGPKPTFLFGNSMSFANKFPMDVFNDWAAKYGHVFGFYEGLRPSVVVSCPDLAHQILVKRFNVFSARPAINPFKHQSQGLSLQHVNGALWKRQRQAVSAGLTTKSIKEMFPEMCHVTSHWMKHLQILSDRSPGGFRIDDIIERYSLDWFARAALGYHSDAMTNRNDVQLRFMRASHESMSPRNSITGLAKLFPSLTPLLKPLDKVHADLSRLQTLDVRQFLQQLLDRVSPGSSDPCHNIAHSLLTRKVTSANITRRDLNTGGTRVLSIQERSQLNEEEIVGEIAGLIGGGVGPISATLTFCLYNMAVYEDVQMRMREELDSVTQCKDRVSLDELGQLYYMESFILETLRLYPVAPGVSRECLEDCCVNGVNFRKGMVIRVMASTMHCREDLFPNHSDFNPDRFKPSGSFSGTYVPKGYIPFGQGPRMCVGQRLAIVSLKLALARVLQCYDVVVSNMTQIPLQLDLRPFIVAKDGVHIRLVCRGARGPGGHDQTISKSGGASIITTQGAPVEC